MRTKKFLSIIASLAILAQSAISAPLALASGEAAKIGLVYSQEAETATDWTVSNATQAETADADGFVKYTMQGTSTWDGNVEIPLTNPVAFEDGKVIVVETVVKATSSTATAGRFGIGMNERDTEQNDVADKDGNIVQNKIGHNKNVLSVLASFDDGFSMGYSNGTTGVNPPQSSISWAYTSPKVTNQLTGAEIYKWVLKIDKPNHKITTELYKKGESGYTLMMNKNDTTLGYVTMQDNLNKLWITEHATVMTDYSIDYVKVYNVPTTDKDVYTKYTQAYPEIAISDVKVDGVAIEDVTEATNGTVTFNATDDVTIAEVSYNTDAGKVTLTGADYTFSDNTVTFTNALVKNVTYTVVLDLGYTTYPITFDSPYEGKLGLVYYQEAETADWTLQKVTASSTADADGFIKYTSTNTSGGWANEANISTIIADLGSDAVRYENDKRVVIETEYKATYGNGTQGRIMIRPNYSDTATTDANGNVVTDKGLGANRNVLNVIMHNGTAGKIDLGYAKKHETTYTSLNWIKNVDGSLDGTTIYKVVIIIDKETHTASHIWYSKAAGATEFTKIGEVTDAGMGYFSNADKLHSIQIGEHANYISDFSINYIKVYNVPEAEAYNYATYGVFSDMKLNGAAVSGTPEIAEGATSLTFTSTQDDVTVKIAKESIKTGAKATLASSEYTFTNNAGVAAKSVTFTTEKGYKYTVTLEVNGAEVPVTFTTPWENQTGLLIDEDGTGSETWTPSSGASFAPVEGEGYLRLAEAANGAYASITLPEPIQLQDDNEVVIDARFRGDKIVNNGDSKGRIQLLINRPETTKMAYNQTGYPDRVVGAEGETMTSYETAYATGANHLALVDVLEDSVLRFAGENWKDGNWYQNNWVDKYTVTELDNVWYRVVVRISKDYWTEYTLYDANDNKLGSWAAYQAWTSKECGNFIKSIQFQNFRWNGLNADLDYLKVYNIEKDSDDAVLTENANTATLTIETPATSEVLGATLYIASYDVSGKLVDVDMATVEGATTTVTVDAGAATYKTFLWDANMKPVAHN